MRQTLCFVFLAGLFATSARADIEFTGTVNATQNLTSAYLLYFGLYGCGGDSCSFGGVLAVGNAGSVTGGKPTPFDVTATNLPFDPANAFSTGVTIAGVYDTTNQLVTLGFDPTAASTIIANNENFVCASQSCSGADESTFASLLESDSLRTEAAGALNQSPVFSAWGSGEVDETLVSFSDPANAGSFSVTTTILSATPEPSYGKAFVGLGLLSVFLLGRIATRRRAGSRADFLG